MKLTDFDPRWHELPGRGRCAFTFLCPRCRDVRLFTPMQPVPMSDQIDFFDSEFPELSDRAKIVPANQNSKWAVTGASFEELTVAPSIDASASGHWHGWIKNGEIA